jgi:hypothetical protein
VAGIRRPERHVLVISAAQDASRRLLAEVATIAVGSPLLSASVVDETSGPLTLSNGSVIRSVPASEAAIRGWSTDLLIVDEAAQLDDHLITAAALPTTAARPDAKMTSSADVALGRSGGVGEVFADGSIGFRELISELFVWLNAAFAHREQLGNESVDPALRVGLRELHSPGTVLKAEVGAV